MSEWLKGLAWKAGVWETAPRVQIPLSPPLNMNQLNMKILYNSILKAISPIKKPMVWDTIGFYLCSHTAYILANTIITFFYSYLSILASKSDIELYFIINIYFVNSS